MLIRRVPDIKPSEITPESVYLNRRELLAQAAASGLIASIAPTAFAAPTPAGAPTPTLQFQRNAKYSVMQTPNTYERDHQLQQLLRVRRRQDRSGA